MIHKELLVKITEKQDPCCFQSDPRAWLILRAVVELHKPQEITLPDGEWGENCCVCDIGWTYPCLTIQVIEKELK